MADAAAVVAGEMPADQLGGRKVGDRAQEAALEQPIPRFPRMATYATTFPAPRSFIEEHGDQWTPPGTMPGNGAHAPPRGGDQHPRRCRAAPGCRSPSR